jgi:hypothetical protein
MLWLKSTGEIHQIKRSWGIKNINIDINIDGLDLKTKEQLLTYQSDKNIEEGWFYDLSDGSTVKEDEVIVGTEDIRDYKINKLAMGLIKDILLKI